MFDPLPSRETAVDACARAMRFRILNGDIAAGTRLPPERQLAERFAVNRVTVRGALAQLAKERLVSVRQGSGYLVRDFRAEGGPELLSGLASLAVERGELAEIVADLLLVRRHLAHAVLTRLAGKRLAKRSLAAVTAAVDAFAAVADSGASLEALAEADLAVVAALLRATDSAVLGLCMNPVARVVGTLPALRETIYADPQSNVVGWRLLCAWLEKSLEQRRAAGSDDIIAALELRDAASVRRIQRGRS